MKRSARASGSLGAAERRGPGRPWRLAANAPRCGAALAAITALLVVLGSPATAGTAILPAPAPGEVAATLPEVDRALFPAAPGMRPLEEAAVDALPVVSVPVADVVAHVRRHCRTVWIGLYEAGRKVGHAWSQAAIVKEAGRELVMLASGRLERNTDGPTVARWHFDATGDGHLVRYGDEGRLSITVQRLAGGGYRRRMFEDGKEIDITRYQGAATAAVELSLGNGELAYLTLLAQGKLSPGSRYAFRGYDPAENVNRVHGSQYEGSLARASGTQHRSTFRLAGGHASTEIHDIWGSLVVRCRNSSCERREPETQATGAKASLEVLAALAWLEAQGVDVRGYDVATGAVLGVERVVLTGRKIADDDLKHLRIIPSLLELDLGDTPVTDRGLGWLDPLGRLRTLKLSGTQISFHGPKQLASLAALRTLWLDRTGIDAAGLFILAELTQLTELHLPERIPAAEVAALQLKLPRCQIRRSPTPRPAGGGGSPLLDPPALSAWLNGLGVRTTPEEVLEIASLTLDGKPVTDEDLARLRAFTQLDRISLDRTGITDRGLPHLAALPGLTSLDLIETDVTDRGLQALEPLRERLQQLRLNGTLITDRALDRLQRFSKLDQLVLPVQVSKGAVARLARALPHCRIWHIAHPADARQESGAKPSVAPSPLTRFRWKGSLAVLLLPVLLGFVFLGLVLTLAPRSGIAEGVTRWSVRFLPFRAVILVGLLLLVAAGLQLHRSLQFLGRARTTEGTVVKLRWTRDSGGCFGCNVNPDRTPEGVVARSGSSTKSSPEYYPIVRFMARSGQTVTFLSRDGSESERYHWLGRKVRVRYDPGDPRNAMLTTLPCRFAFYWSSLLPGVLGLLLLIGGGIEELKLRSKLRKQT